VVIIFMVVHNKQTVKHEASISSLFRETYFIFFPEQSFLVSLFPLAELQPEERNSVSPKGERQGNHSGNRSPLGERAKNSQAHLRPRANISLNC